MKVIDMEIFVDSGFRPPLLMDEVINSLDQGVLQFYMKHANNFFYMVMQINSYRM